MTFPVIADTSTSSEAVNTTAHTVDLSTLDMTVGNLLLVFFAYDDNQGATFTWPGTDYTQILDVAASLIGLEIRYRQIDGGEGSSFDITSSASEQSAHCIYEISGAIDPATQAPEGSTGASGESTTPDPDTVTPTGGAKEYIYIGATSTNTGSAVTGYPSNCPDSQITINSAGGNGVSCAIGSDQINAASFNPTTFTIDASEEWIAAAIAVHPAVSASDVGFRPALFPIAQRRSTLLRM